MAQPVPPVSDRGPTQTTGGARGFVGRASRSIVSLSGVRGAAVEGAWIAGHIALYPFGLSRERGIRSWAALQTQNLPPAQRGLVIGDVEAAGTPILLVHGIVDNRSVFTLLRRNLHRRGFGSITSFNYNSLGGDLRDVAGRFGNVVESLCDQTGYERLHVIGHSMGGLMARYYVQCLGGDAHVHTLVTLGTPHQGTVPARWLPLPAVRQLRPESELIRALAEPAPHCRTRFVSIWSDLDQMVLPSRAATIVHPDLNARNVFVRGVGHISLPMDGRVVHEIGLTLAHLDAEGQTVTPRATSIASH